MINQTIFFIDKNMRVKIVGFKCHLDTHYDFSPDSMTLLKGDSGAGKSTILQAIYWSLYGSMRGIYNNSGVTKKCSVTLQINQLIVYRQKGPELLKVTLVNQDETEQVYEDDVAQQIIDQAFGSKELWKSCSYIGQKERCSLLSGSAAERLTLLNQLSFDRDNPKDYITRIDQELKTINSNFLSVQAEFTAELNRYSDQLKIRPVKLTLAEDDITQLNTYIGNLQAEVALLYQEVLTHERNIGSYNTILAQIKSSQIRLDSIDVAFFDEDKHNARVNDINSNIQGLRNILTNANHYGAIKQQVTAFQSQIQTNETQLNDINNKIKATEATIENKKPPDINVVVTNQMIWQATQQESLLQQGVNACSELGCQYDQDAINNMIKNYQQQLSDAQNMGRNLSMYNQLKSLKHQLNSLDVNDNVDIKELEDKKQEITLEIAELKKGLELLQCPECAKPLRYVNRQLVPGERDPVSPAQIHKKESEYQDILNEITRARSVLSLCDQIKTIEGQLVGINLESLENYVAPDTNKIQTLTSRLTRIQIVQAPQYSSDLLKRVLDYQQTVQSLTSLTCQRDNLMDKGNDLKKKLSEIVLPNSPGTNTIEIHQTITKHEFQLKQLNNEYQKYLQRKAEHNQIKSTISLLTVQKDQIEKSLNPTAKTLHQTTQDILITAKQKLDDGLYGNTILSHQKELETSRQEVINLNEDLTALQRLKQNAIETECKQLQDTVDTINSSLGDILPLFFNEPITVMFQLYKVLKTKKELKPGLNISIKYKGVEYDNINQLSGGEGDRISLGLVLALNSVSNSPIVLLDECISSLDGAVKESCIDAMKSLIKTLGKTIICVDHEGVEGIYDQTITVRH